MVQKNTGRWLNCGMIFFATTGLGFESKEIEAEKDNMLIAL